MQTRFQQNLISQHNPLIIESHRLYGKTNRVLTEANVQKFSTNFLKLDRINRKPDAYVKLDYIVPPMSGASLSLRKSSAPENRKDCSVWLINYHYQV